MTGFGKFLSKCTVISAAFSIGVAFAADRVPRDRTITSISHYNDWVAIQFEPAYTNDLGCGATDPIASTYVVLDWRDDVDKKPMLGSVLTSYALGSTIGFGIDGCWNQFGGGVPRVYRVDLDASTP
jgi:hypothetical protein